MGSVVYFYFSNLHWPTQPPALGLCFYSVHIFLSLLPLLVCCLLTLRSCLIIVQGNLKEVHRVFQGSFKCVKGSFKKGSSVFQENIKKALKGVSRMFH